MVSLYLFSLVVGGGLLLVSVFGNVLGDELPHDIGTDIDAAGTKLLSLRTATYFLFGFGGVGATLSWLWGGENAGLTMWLSLGSGTVLGGLAAVVFRYLRTSESGMREAEDSFVGLTGVVTLPLSERGVGKVLVRRRDRAFELMARPHGHDGAGAEHWSRVVIVEMERGTALVAPYNEGLESAADPAAPSLQPGDEHVR